ncbi:MAG: hypothetical protein FWD19_05665, partial [Defluviitaleaceae bacterium]|nr:hypothetical protein [Defluviitaleaceae bacterium]
MNEKNLSSSETSVCEEIYWHGFKKGAWCEEINLRDFIQQNVTPYEGDENFLAAATERTKILWEEVCALLKIENENGILDAETKIPSGINSHAPGYINEQLEKIVGVQTDKPLKRGIMPKGGIRVIKNALKSYGFELDPFVEEIYTKHRKAHNDGVFDAYTEDMRAARKSGIITGLPDAYGRGRIIGDYRRVALYGTEFLIREKEKNLRGCHSALNPVSSTGQAPESPHFREEKFFRASEEKNLDEEKNLREEKFFRASKEKNLDEENFFRATKEKNLDEENFFHATEEKNLDEEKFFRASKEKNLDDEKFFRASEEKNSREKKFFRASEEKNLREEIQLREEISEQIRALKQLEEMARSYGFDVSRPAACAQEAIQWTYFAFLAAAKQQDGAATSLGRVASFLDIFIERDLKNKKISESEAQELMDDFAMKLRLIRFLRTPEYNALFSGDPTWVTEAVGGMCQSGRTLVTKNSFRMIHTLTTLGPAPEPNLTILWSNSLPENFKKYCAKISIETSSLQYENDDLMRKYWGDDYAIACCVSAMRIGKQMQFFGARANFAKALTYAINGGKDEVSGVQIAPAFAPITSEILDYDEVFQKFLHVLDWLAQLYINTLNIIHYMHDKYNYESLQMSLHDAEILRTHACGIAGLSVVVDSFSAIKHAKVKPIRKNGIAVDYEIEGDFPAFGNNDERADEIANELVKIFMQKLNEQT